MLILQFTFSFFTTELTWENTPVTFVVGFVLQAISSILLIYDFCSDDYTASKVAIYLFNTRLALNFSLKMDENELAKSFGNTIAITLMILGNSLLLSLVNMRFRNLQFVLTFIVTLLLLGYKFNGSINMF